MFKLFLILILIIIIFYILNKFFFKKTIKENYLTYFLPFYDDKTNDLAQFYINNDNNLNYFKKKFDYNILKFGTNVEQKFFVETLIKYYISNSYLIKSDIKYYSDKFKPLDDLINNKINFLIYEYSCINYYTNVLKKSINNIRLITTLYREYIYMFTKKTYNVFSINDIPPTFIIGIMKQKDDISIYYNIFFKNLGFIENTDYKVIFYEDINTLFNGLNNNECNMIILSTIFPNDDIKYILQNSLNPDIILLPFDIPNEELFLKKQPIINIDYIDLNYLSKSYLPKKFGKYQYNRNRPTIKLCYLNKILLTNIYTSPKRTYEFIKFYYENYKILNNNIDKKGYKIYNININNYKTSFLEYHKGVLDFFRDKGYITNNNNNNCKYLIGTSECTDKTLKENNLYYDMIIGN
jgi:TRAP-type uncharacterized transport system substrate-binding protein